MSLGVDTFGAPDWSTDGLIAYADFNGDIDTVRPDGTGQTVLASPPAGLFATNPTWAPDSSALAFDVSDGNGGPGQVYTIHADGSDQTNISNDNTDDETPVWSPDGTKIVFNEGGPLATMNPDGSAKAPIGSLSDIFPTSWAANPATPPTVTAVSPTSGAQAGGTSVTITGTGFTGATAVDFGTTPASSFTVNSDTSITAIAPAASSVGTVDITVTTPAGTSTTTAADRYSYAFTFTGWQAPVANPPTYNKVNAGQAVPMAFSLGANFGLGIIAAGYPTATQVSCTTGAPLNSGTPTNTAGASGLRYDAGTDTYVWKTAKSMAGTCQEFDMRLIDGTDHTALFTFTK